MASKNKFHPKEILHELKHHIPFTVLASFVGVIIAFILIRVNQIPISTIAEYFEIAHPIHVIFSAMVTSAIFYKYKKSKLPAILVGITGAIIIGSLSDILLPYLGGLSFGFDMHFHLPILEAPFLILTAALVGTIIGMISGITKLPHFFHVLLSVVASILYLAAFSFASINSTLVVLLATLIVFISVIIPCCVSDILYPFFFLGEKIKSCGCH